MWVSMFYGRPYILVDSINIISKLNRDCMEFYWNVLCSPIMISWLMPFVTWFTYNIYIYIHIIYVYNTQITHQMDMGWEQFCTKPYPSFQRILRSTTCVPWDEQHKIGPELIVLNGVITYHSYEWPKICGFPCSCSTPFLWSYGPLLIITGFGGPVCKHPPTYTRSACSNIPIRRYHYDTTWHQIVMNPIVTPITYISLILAQKNQPW